LVALAVGISQIINPMCILQVVEWSTITLVALAALDPLSLMWMLTMTLEVDALLFSELNLKLQTRMEN
jgi:hypothetical protein